MADPVTAAFTAGVSAVTTAVVLGVKWVTPLILPGFFKAGQSSTALAQPSVVECVGCHALRVEVEKARTEIAVAAQALAVLSARAEEREHARRERLQEAARQL